MSRARILVADDDVAMREMMRLSLEKEGYEVSAAATAAAVARLLAEGPFDLVVSDIYLGDGTAIDLLATVGEKSPRAKVILVTAQGTVETVAAAREAGVFDYLAKPFDLDALVGRVEAALGRRAAPAARVAAGPESMIIGSDPAIVEVYKAVSRVARLPVPVLIRGETGTGKELVARALHRFGANPGGPWVAVNCGAIPENLLESELFGHRRGAFTGAVRDHQGSIEAARGGTILLDEIGEVPAFFQVKLLRFLQEGEIRPVGAGKGIEVPVRVLAATHRDLRREVAAGDFREDFYYRLGAYEIVLPPLRRRPGDIPALVEHFHRRYRRRFGLQEAAPPSEEVLRFLARQPWPGNVRQLENLVQRALIDLGGLADVRGLRSLLGEPEAEREDPAPAIGDDLTLEDLERLHIEAVLRRCRGNRSRTAKMLGIGRRSLYRKAERLGISLDPKGDEP